MFVYTAYGLGIHSALPLPELVAAQSACDVVVRLAAEDYVPLGIRADTWCVHITPEDAWLAFDRVGMFRVRNGRAILVTPANGVDERLLQLNLVGLVLAVLLYQRGLLVLHASAVRVGRYAVAFMAESGQGKSSTALALHTRGHGMIAAARVRHLAERIARGGISAGEAADEIAKPCVCGIVNRERAERIFLRMAGRRVSTHATKERPERLL